MPNLPTQMYLLKFCPALWYFSKNIPLMTLFSLVASSSFTSTIHSWSFSKATLSFLESQLHQGTLVSESITKWAQCNSWQDSLSCLPTTLSYRLGLQPSCPVLVGQQDELALSSLIRASGSLQRSPCKALPHHLMVHFLPFLYNSSLERRLLTSADSPTHPPLQRNLFPCLVTKQEAWPIPCNSW